MLLGSANALDIPTGAGNTTHLTAALATALRAGMARTVQRVEQRSGRYRPPRSRVPAGPTLVDGVYAA